jgi:hypothetical protein
VWIGAAGSDRLHLQAILGMTIRNIEIQSNEFPKQFTCDLWRFRFVQVGLNFSLFFSLPQFGSINIRPCQVLIP